MRPIAEGKVNAACVSLNSRHLHPTSCALPLRDPSAPPSASTQPLEKIEGQHEQADILHSRRINIMELTAISKFERLFREAASLDVDKEDLRRLNDFFNHKVEDLLIRGVANAKANARDVIWPADLPITKGLQENIHAFKKIDKDIQLTPVLDQLTKVPVLELDYGDETRAMLPQIAGGLSVALAHSFKIIDPDMKNPLATKHWERAFKLFDEIL
jgi:hypothetical protein